MLGAITGDIVGSIYEAAPIKTKRFPLFGAGVSFTDDTVPTLTPATWTSLSGASPADSPKYAEYVVPLPKNGSWSEKYVVAVTSTISGAPLFGSRCQLRIRQREAPTPVAA